jgi:hypothetical protein
MARESGDQQKLHEQNIAHAEGKFMRDHCLSSREIL